jgi:Sulfotransferase family
MTTAERTAPRPTPAGPVQPRLLFINGFHRSGTTVMTSAVTEAVCGVTTTVSVLARHIPTLDAFLETLSDGTVDRGADRLQVTPQTAEEYGFLLHHRTGEHALYGHPDGLRLLREHVAELAAEAPHATVVLKNPWEVGHEAQLLADFPDARIIILRRRLADIERSVDKALLRASSSAYFRALDGESEHYHRVRRLLGSRWKRPLLLWVLRLVARRRAWRLAESVRELPLDQVAFLSYDELRADPKAGAAWAAHLLDPQALAEAFTKHAFAEQSAPAPSSMVQRALDRRLQRAWTQARAEQVQAGIVAPATGVAGTGDRLVRTLSARA